MTFRRCDIFPHFLNRDSRQIYGLFHEFESARHRMVLGRALNAAAILCEARCIAPPGFVVECEIAQAVMERKSAYLRERLIELPMREASLSDFVEKKRQEYAPMRAAYEGLFNEHRIEFLADNASGLIRRKVVIGESIAKSWRAGPDESKRLWKPIAGLVAVRSVDYLLGIPEHLIESGIAATWPAIYPHLPRDALSADKDLRRVLQHDYYSLYVREFRLIVVRNLPFMQDNFGLPSVPKIYDYERLKAYFDQIAQAHILDADAETILFLRKQFGFIRFIDAYAGLCTHCKPITDLRFHVNRLARSTNIPWNKFSEFWKKSALTGEYKLGEESAVEIADALGYLATRIEVAFSLSVRAKDTTKQSLSLKPAIAHVRATMTGDNPGLVIFVALEEEFGVLQRCWNLKRHFMELAASGNINGFTIDVVCARNRGAFLLRLPWVFTSPSADVTFQRCYSLSVWLAALRRNKFGL
jgi:hypothetical protein